MSDRIGLVVDDEPSIRTYLRAILERAGYQCLEAGNSAQALRIIQKIGGRVDVVIADIAMPGEMDGVDMAYSVRHSFPGVPIILISGFSESASAKSAAVDFDFVSKPFVPDTILKAVERAVASKGFKVADNQGGG